uniref:Uncharacterized protein n=1 Tax=Ditylenchus dipsaci TaxID=166011 RepID=A0A915DI53_9BILA
MPIVCEVVQRLEQGNSLSQAEASSYEHKWNEVSEEEVVSIQQAAKLSENGADAQPSDVVGNASEVEHKVEERTQQMNSL